MAGSILLAVFVAFLGLAVEKSKSKPKHTIERNPELKNGFRLFVGFCLTYFNICILSIGPLLFRKLPPTTIRQYIISSGRRFLTDTLFTKHQFKY